MRASFFAGLALAAIACAPLSPPQAGWRSAEIFSAPASLGAENTGALRFLGGIALRSDDRDFGGISDIALAGDGAFFAVTDAGYFVRGQVRFNAAGGPAELRDAALSPMRNEAGLVYPNKEAADAEGLALLPDGRVAVSFEQDQTIRIFARNPEGDMGPATPGPRLAEVAALSANQGLEALALTPDGALLVGSEEGDASGAMIWRAPLSGAAPAPVLARLPKPEGFGLVELEALPNGEGYIALQRFYAPAVGNQIRVLRLLIGEDGQIVQTVLAELRPPLALDNFEALSVFQGENGAVRIALMSDDNFNARQRTLLYVFELATP